MSLPPSASESSRRLKRRPAALGRERDSPGATYEPLTGGLAAGFGIAYLAGTPRYQDSTAEQVWRIAAWFGVIIAAISFFKMYMAFSHYT